MTMPWIESFLGRKALKIECTQPTRRPEQLLGTVHVFDFDQDQNARQASDERIKNVATT